MLFACCITRATDTLISYYIYCSSMATMVRQKHPKFGYTYISSPVLCVLYLSTLSNILPNLSCLSEIDWRSLLFLGFVHLLNFFKNTMFRKPALLPSSGKEAINLVDTLECVTGQRFGSRFCFRLRSQNTQPSGPFISSYSRSLGITETLSLLGYAPENRSRPWVVRGKQLQKN
jgi:hypothetical protein